MVLIVADCVKDKLGIVQGKKVREKEGEREGEEMPWTGQVCLDWHCSDCSLMLI